MDTDVAVIGAGASGLAAALELAALGLRVTVVEARDRTGGRVRWETAGAARSNVELGAEFIHGDAPATTGFLREAAFKTVPVGDVSWTCDSSGRFVRDDESFLPTEIFREARSLETDESVEAFLHRFEHDPGRRGDVGRARSFVEGFEAADPAIASVRSIADELRSGVDSSTTRPAGGYALLFGFLASRCVSAGITFCMNAAVEHIAWETGRVTISARSVDGAAVTIGARCAIVTVPAGVLQRAGGPGAISFEPPLPSPKLQALQGLSMGHVVRVMLAFRTSFWEEIDDGRYRDAAFFRCEGGAFHAYWTQSPQRAGTIAAWAGGPRATAMHGLAGEQRIERALAGFGAMLGSKARAAREFQEGVTHDWSSDPYACGAYSYVNAGALSARAALALPIDGTLFFAGEATAASGQGGTVNGAFESGKRAAREAALALGAQAERPVT